jgi:hypothetical protein
LETLKEEHTYNPVTMLGVTMDPALLMTAGGGLMTMFGVLGYEFVVKLRSKVDTFKNAVVEHL